MNEYVAWTEQRIALQYVYVLLLLESFNDDDISLFWRLQMQRTSRLQQQDQMSPRLAFYVA